ncbi:AAA family ATPase [Halobellus sp. EA9]|uniref:AAA family ATPase n=1 Tax=Halobellus sp. EA9 TaxID=3421647 RepID=UPI003EB8B65E
MTGRLIVVAGLPGVGKTTVSREITDRLDGRLIRTDVVRKDRFPDPQYTVEERVAVYDELFARGRREAADGGVAVLDGTFRKRADRDRAAAVAAEIGVPLDIVAVECDAAVVERRIREREGDESDADVEIYRQFRDRYEPIERTHATIDNSGDLASTRRQVAEALAAIKDRSSDATD